jgi:hypothetical protein
MPAPRGGLDRATLQILVERGLSTREIAAEVDRSQATVRHWLRRYGLRTKRRGRSSRQNLRGKYAQGRCTKHGSVRFVREGRGYYRCTRCRADRVAERRRRIKEILVAEAGGRCRLCGYDRYLGALEFHHVDPAQKRFSLSLHGLTRGLEPARAEARKCVLLCSNCHAEVEGGLVGATLVAGRMSEVGPTAIPGGAIGSAADC